MYCVHCFPEQEALAAAAADFTLCATGLNIGPSPNVQTIRSQASQGQIDRTLDLVEFLFTPTITRGRGNTRLSGKINVRAAIGSPRRPGDMEQEQQTGCFYSELTDDKVETEPGDAT